jgi:hypothetical protein
MKKFRALLLSMVMFTSVCPLYGFAPVKAVAEDGGDEPTEEVSRRLYPAEVEVKNAIKDVQNAIEKITAERVNASEVAAKDALTNEDEEDKGALELLKEAYDLKSEAQETLEGFYDQIVDEEGPLAKANAAKAAALADQAAAEQDAVDASKDLNKAQRTRRRSTAYDAAWDAAGKTSDAWGKAWDAVSQSKTASDAVKEANGLKDAAQNYYDNVVDAEGGINDQIDDLLTAALDKAGAAKDETAAALTEATETKDALDDTKDIVDVLATAAGTNLNNARIGLFGSVMNLIGSVADVRSKTQDVAAKGVAADVVQNIDNKVTDIEQTSTAKTAQDKINKNVNRNVWNAKDAIDSLLKKADEDDQDTLGYRVLAEMGYALDGFHVTSAKHFVAGESLSEANSRLDGSKEDLEESVKAVSTNVVGVHDASAKLARSVVVNEIVTAVKELVDTADAQATTEYEAALAADTQAGIALQEVLEAQGTEVNDRDLKKAIKAAGQVKDASDATATATAATWTAWGNAGTSTRKAFEEASKKRRR